MVLEVYGSAALIMLASVVLGRAICMTGSREPRWGAAPAVGLATVIVLSEAAIRLPGHAVTAAVIIGVLLVAGLVWLVRGARRPLQWSDLAIIALPILGASIPFLASGRVGLQGVGLDNDTASHLLWAETLHSSAMAHLWYVQSGYPLGPHSLIATVGTATGIPLDLVLCALLLAVTPLTALVAADALGGQALWRRVVAATVCALAYLLAAYYGEGAFKETIMGTLLLAFAVGLAQAQGRWADLGGRARAQVLLGGLLLIAGGFYTYSYLALAWFGATGVLWAAAEVVRRPRTIARRLSWHRLRSAAPWIAGTLLVAIVIVLPVAGRTLSFLHSIGSSPAATGAIAAGNLGNLAGPLSPYEVFGVWWSPDFRFPVANLFHAGELSAVGAAAAIYGLLWSLRRRQFALPAAVVGSMAIWWFSHRTQSPYVTAKALVIASPVIMALSARALLTRNPQEDRLARALRLAIGACFCAAAAYSSYQALRDEPVQAPTATHELASFRQAIAGAPVLFLGDDDYAPWQLRAAPVSTLAPTSASRGGATARPNKPFAYGSPLDFDSVQPPDLNHFRYVVTSNTPYASQAPSSFRLVRSTRLYDLWQRTAPVTARQIIEPSAAPGAILNCHTAVGRKLRAARGVAAIMPTPVTAAGTGLTPGGSTTVSLPLPAGRWELSIAYSGDLDLAVSAESRHWTMPAYQGRPGPYFAVGAVTGHGTSAPVDVTLATPRPSPITGDRLITTATTVAATRIPDTRRVVPLRRACGRYVDWYRLSGS